MARRQPPVIRAGSGDTHDARVAVLEKRFSDDMQARCSWCNRITGARLGRWIEVFLSTPGSGIAPAHVFRCEQCEGSVSEAVGTTLLVVPRQSARSTAGQLAGTSSGPVNGGLAGARAPKPSLAPIGTDPRPKTPPKPKQAASTAKRKTKPKASGSPASINRKPAVAPG